MERLWPGTPGLLLVALAGCPVIQATQELPCETSGDCPRRWVCVNNSCQVADGGVHDAMLADGGSATDRATGRDSSGRDLATGVDQRRADGALPRDAARADTSVRTDTRRPDTTVAHDSATPHDAATGVDVPCGNVSFVGACQGDLLKWCENGGLKTYDCAVRVGTWASCGLYDCTDTGVDGQGNPLCYGYGCVAELNQPCNVAPNFLGCNLDLGHGCRGDACVAASSCDSATDPPTCTGNRVNFCPYGRLWDYDCSQGNSAPYVCQDTGNGNSDCLGTAGGNCNLTSNPPWNCATGYTCTNGTCS